MPCVYILRSLSKPNRSYVGATKDLVKRLARHNGWLSGGAKYTKMFGPWKVMCVITGFETWNQALSFEKLNQKLRYRRKGACYRLNNLKRCLLTKKWINRLTVHLFEVLDFFPKSWSIVKHEHFFQHLKYCDKSKRGELMYYICTNYWPDKKTMSCFKKKK